MRGSGNQGRHTQAAPPSALWALSLPQKPAQVLPSQTEHRAWPHLLWLHQHYFPTTWEAMRGRGSCRSCIRYPYVPLALPQAQWGCLSLPDFIEGLGPTFCSTKCHPLGPCQDLSLEFASENSWLLLTGEGRAVPGFRISIHTAQKFSCTSNFSLTVCHSFLFSSPSSLSGSCNCSSKESLGSYLLLHK